MFSISVAIVSFVDLFFLNPNRFIKYIVLVYEGWLAITFSRTFERAGTRVKCFSIEFHLGGFRSHYSYQTL
jgi:hypothetical protein